MSEEPEIAMPSEEEVRKFGGAAPAEKAEPAAAPAQPAAAEPQKQEEGPLAGLTEEEIRQMAAETAQYREAAQRAVADLANFRKRTFREKPREALLARRELLDPVVAALDHLQKTLDASQSAADDPAAALHALVEGVRMARGGLVRDLGAFNFKPIETQGVNFDPKIHEAVGTEPREDMPPGTIVTVLSEGYRLDDLVIRPARVVVAVAKEEPKA